MSGNEVFKVAVTELAHIVDETLEANNLDRSQIDWLVPHQANLRIISATAKKLGMGMEKVVVTLDRHGNTSAASVRRRWMKRCAMDALSRASWFCWRPLAAVSHGARRWFVLTEGTKDDAICNGFPGQGSQTVGMLAELAAENPIIEATFKEASDALGYDLWQLTQQGPAEELNKTADATRAAGRFGRYLSLVAAEGRPDADHDGWP